MPSMQFFLSMLQTVQFSIDNPATLLKSRWLRVNKINPQNSAMDAIRASIALFEAVVTRVD